ncbi:MAG: DUF1592 domain-containing protein [Alphaproteobacteria bacterium]|nr:DUF1592 domain-containing protein [Alphaproteobacteria bacterium]
MTLLLTALLALGACDKAAPVDSGSGLTDPGPAPEVEAPAPALRRLTTSQFRNVVRDLFGEGMVLTTQLEPDTVEEGFLSVGASVAAVSALGVERYELVALSLADQALEDETRLDALLPCTPESADDAVCAEDFVRSFGRRAWRRPLSEDEVSRLVGVITWIGGDTGSFEEGLRYGLAAMLQSPHFLYRREHGQVTEGGQRQLTDHELASRLSFFLWNTTPDDVLLDAADAGLLSAPGGLEDQAWRMLDDPRANDGLRNLFTELYHLYELDDLDKDPLVFTHASAELGPAAREETLRVLEQLILEDDADFRTLFTTQDTFVDRRLAALYGVPAPTLDDSFAAVRLERSGGRRGLLGQASFLLLNAHATRSSATLRGKFVREVLLCQAIPPPPGDVDTSIPETDASSPTLRDRIASHLEVESCATCHRITDPLGLGLENFDGVARWRLTENDATIDASGELDGEAFDDAWQLGRVLSEHEDVPSCISSHVYHYAVGHGTADGEEALVDWLTQGFVYDGHSFRSLLIRTITSPGFAQVGGLE